MREINFSEIQEFIECGALDTSQHCAAYDSEFSCVPMLFFAVGWKFMVWFNTTAHGMDKPLISSHSTRMQQKLAAAVISHVE